MMAPLNWKSQPGSKFNEAEVPPKPLKPANDNSKAPPAPKTVEADKPKIVATEWKWVNPKTIPPRSWLYGYHYIRKYISTTVSPGGLGKTSNSIVEALSMASDRSLVGERVHERCRVWLFNEDPRDELDRRIAAACLHYGIKPEEIAGRLFVDSFREQSFVAAVHAQNRVEIAIPFAEVLEAEIKRREIDVLIMDPFVSTHRVSENDNMMIDAVIKQFWQPILERTNCAVEFVHHSKKLGGAEVTAESARGAVALIGAARSARALNGMTREEADKAHVDNHRLYFRITDAKANMAPPSAKSTWRKLESISLGNDTASRPTDLVGVATEWKWPGTMAGVTVADLRAAQAEIASGEWMDAVQAGEKWAGHAVAKAMGLDLDNRVDKALVRECLKAWKANGMFKVESRNNEKREPRNYLVVGEWAVDTDPGEP
ncbi:hypothetical protein ABIF90_000580 [Bradyrhizobium japonicum]